jgi:hypothetical protein
MHARAGSGLPCADEKISGRMVSESDRGARARRRSELPGGTPDQRPPKLARWEGRSARWSSGHRRHDVTTGHRETFGDRGGGLSMESMLGSRCKCTASSSRYLLMIQTYDSRCARGEARNACTTQVTAWTSSPRLRTCPEVALRRLAKAPLRSEGDVDTCARRRAGNVSRPRRGRGT